MARLTIIPLLQVHRPPHGCRLHHPRRCPGVSVTFLTLGLVQGPDIAIICVLTIGISGTLAASFGVFAGTAALFMFGEVPRVRRDILQQIPGLDTYYDRRIAPEDNVSPAPLVFLSLAICLLILALLNYLRSYLERPC
jgi:hypothetical protein